MFKTKIKPVTVAGNKPFLLDDPGAVWIVEEGRIEVFTVAVKDGEPEGARSHFVTVDSGQALFGMDFAAHGFGSGFLAAGKTGTKLRLIARDKLEQMASGKFAGLSSRGSAPM